MLDIRRITFLRVKTLCDSVPHSKKHSLNKMQLNICTKSSWKNIFQSITNSN